MKIKLKYKKSIEIENFYIKPVFKWNGKFKGWHVLANRRCINLDIIKAIIKLLKKGNIKSYNSPNHLEPLAKYFHEALGRALISHRNE